MSTLHREPQATRECREWEGESSLGKTTGIVQYQMISPGNIYTSYIIQTEPVIFRNKYVHTYIHVTTISEKRGHKFERGLEGFGGKK